ncbi:MAG TPA: glycoside hydrolase family 38 C-terminal domain-containing protein [Amycolatopsis sp.]|nr:glycoside hydrolase family 38 C-terminal domain-containing protein [Amycolatopsis sp.]
MHDDRGIIEERITRVLDHRLRPAVHRASVPLEVAAWQAPGEPVPVSEGLGATFTPIRSGDRWGPAWSTTWFRVTATVPAEWAGETVEAVIDLGFDPKRTGFECEGLVYTPDGEALKGLNPRNQWVRIADKAEGSETVELYVEAAANPVLLDYVPFVVTPLGDKETAGPDPLYRLGRLDLVVFDETVWELINDIEVLDQLMRELPLEGARRWTILRTLNAAIDRIDLQDIAGTAQAARDVLAPAFAVPAEPSAHRISAVGHAHIDSAWLWPTRETVRKVARTAANVTSLLDRHPEFVFAMSSAQQLAWIEEHRPEVFVRVREAIRDGRFVPVGGMWVESDTNMPGGEALARQFVHGKRYFLEKFGVETEEVWLPDSFGYTAALPQLVALSASKWFLTQKISWSRINRFPHHTFWWEGIDGTRVFTHFPPADTYNSELSGRELAHAARNFREKGNATRSLVPFGWGDGGGGPTREMLARAARLSDVEGSPRVTIEKPADFFAAAQEEYPNAPVWAGELYLEAHRGTYTSQAKTKQGNRRSEHLLREAELWCTLATVREGAEYPYEQLDRIWKQVLLNQFHDILPGSSIAWVHREARETYAAIAAELEALIHAAQRTLAGDGDQVIVFDATPQAMRAEPLRHDTPAVRVHQDGDRTILDNDVLRVTFTPDGVITSIVDNVREVLPPEGRANLLQLHPDFPVAWDAWDVEEFYRNTVTDLTGLDTFETDDGGAVRIIRRFGDSEIEQVVSLSGRRIDIETTVDWHETEKFLKLAFELDVHTLRSAAEIQFGHVFRPTHTNTSWDAAKFEICAHRWLHVGEPGYGVALANDATYGHDVTRSPGQSGASTTIRASLLRAPRYPDPDTDHGRHRFRHTLVPGAEIADAVREGYRINLPQRAVENGNPVAPLVSVDNPAVVIEAVKLAEDRSGDLVVRLYESLGGRATARLSVDVPVNEAYSVDLLERRAAFTVDHPVNAGEIRVSLRPFEVRTLRVRRG